MADKVHLSATRGLTADDVAAVVIRFAPVVVEDSAVARVSLRGRLQSPT